MKATLALLLTVTVTGVASAATYVSNLSESHQGLGFGGIACQATSFITGTSGDFDVSRVTLEIQIGSPSITVGIYSSSDSSPGSLLAEFKNPSNGYGLNDFTYSGGAFTLIPDTQYFLVVSAPDTGLFGAQTTMSNTSNSTSDTGWSIGDDRYLSFDSGSSFFYVGTGGLRFELGTAAVVPEPSSALLGGLGLLGLLRRRRA